MSIKIVKELQNFETTLLSSMSLYEIFDYNDRLFIKIRPMVLDERITGEILCVDILSKTTTVLCSITRVFRCKNIEIKYSLAIG